MTSSKRKIYDYIVVLCPEINPEDKGKFTNFKHGLYLGGKVRMEAAYKLYQQNKKTILILVADYDKDDGSRVYSGKSHRTDSMKSYLLNLGVPEKNLHLTNSLPCTRHNLVAVFNNFKDLFKGKNIALLTNLYHLPRSLSFWMELKKAKKYSNIPHLPDTVSAEDVINTSIRYKKSSMYIARLELEARGMIDLLTGKYNDGCIKKNPESGKIIIRSDYERIVKKNTKNILSPSEIKLI